ncbi:DNA polymerase III subunit gamma and tau [Actinomycetes bacterium KLBMP 9797]
MALALYRKYRPRTFAEVIGQEHVTEPLSQALRSGRLHHAYLFSGPRGCGKTSSARILARSLNCAQGPTPEPCGQCDSCKSLATDGAGSIDVIEIDAASHGGVDDARELRERAFFAPASSRYKIYVIDEAHMVSSAGFNALLKLVEEPPDYVKFIFATTEPEKVLGTIKSRTHHYPFRLIPPGILRPYLEQLCSVEGVKVESAVFPLVVRAGGGSARDTLSVLDQLIAGAGPEGVTYGRAVALLGVTDVALIDEMCDALAANDGAAAYATIDRVAEAGHDSRRFASDLLERLRDLIVLQQVPDAAAKGLIDGPSDQVERMTAQAQRLGPATLSRCADIVHNGLVEMRGTTAPRLLLELVTARMLLPGADDGANSLLSRLERMERRLAAAGDGDVPALSAPPRPPAAARPAAAESPVTGPPTAPAPIAAPRSTAPTAPRAETPRAEAPRTETPGAAAPRAEAPRAEPAGPAAPRAEAPGSTAPPGGAPGQTAPQPATQVQQAPPRRALPPEAVMPDPATPEPERPGSSPPGQLDAAALRRSWGEVLEMVNNQNKRIAALVRNATVRDLDGDTVILTFQYPVHASMVSKEAQVLADAAYEVFGVRWEFRCEVAGDQRAPEAATRAPAAPAPAPRKPAAAPAPQAAPPKPASAREDDWPEPARPGGVAPAAPAPPAPPAKTPPARPTVERKTVERNTAGRTPAGRTEAGRNTAERNTAERKTADSDWAGEPPYDPDYDGPSGKRAATAATPVYEGFDPGDEPTDEVVDERTARQSSEQQAVQLLQQAFGAEKIGEV